MLSHRIDYGHLLMGPVAHLVARTKRFVDVRQGHPSDLEDWVAIIADYESGARDLETVAVPREFAVWPHSPRDPAAGDPLVTFRYDQNYEFYEAILERRPCRPSFEDGARAQAVMDVALESDEQ